MKTAKAYDYNLLLELGLHKKIPFEQILLTVDSERKKRSLFRRLPPVKSSSDMNLFLKLEAKINPSNEYRTIRLPRIDYDTFKSQEGLSFTKNLLRSKRYADVMYGAIIIKKDSSRKRRSDTIISKVENSVFKKSETFKRSVASLQKEEKN